MTAFQRERVEAAAVPVRTVQGTSPPKQISQRRRGTSPAGGQDWHKELQEPADQAPRPKYGVGSRGGAGSRGGPGAYNTSRRQAKMALQSIVQPQQMSTVAFEQQVDQAALLTNILKGFVVSHPRGPDDGQMSFAQASSIQVTPSAPSGGSGCFSGGDASDTESHKSQSLAAARAEGAAEAASLAAQAKAAALEEAANAKQALEDIRQNCAVLQAKTEILERELKDAKSALLDSQKNAEMQYNKGLDKGAEISRSAR